MELNISQNFMKNLIRQMVQVSRSAFSLSSNSHRLSRSVSDQKVQVKQVQDENNDTAREARKILEESSQLNKRAISADDSSRKGREMQQVYLENMKVLSGSLQKGSDFLEEFRKSAEDISRLTELILDISSRLDVLSINGAIEAARRGDAGLGFAVITREMKKLSEESAVSADRVKSIITQFDKASSDLQKLFSDSEQSLNDSSKDADGIYKAFLSIEEQNREMAGRADTITSLMESLVQRNENRQTSAGRILDSIHSSSSQIDDVAGESDDLHSVVESTLKNIGGIRLDWHDKALVSVQSIAGALESSSDSALEVLGKQFSIHPYIELLYLMDEKGIQVENNAVHPDFSGQIDEGGKGEDRSRKPYFSELASGQDSYISDLYVSTAVNHLCLTISIPCRYRNQPHVLAADMNLDAFVNQ
ncbi:MAG: methyl-accepting chemotaxis protein [Spirochaetales bacterium]|nr:methyl-accepting chemotaxis protein [Spirochaetales bacterium]